MKHAIRYRLTGLLAGLLLTAAAHGREGNPVVSRHGETLRVRLTLAAGVPLSANEQLTVTPVIINGELREQLAPVVFTGRIREKVDRRRERLYGTQALPDDAYGNIVVGSRREAERSEVTIVAQVPYESWMSGGRVVLERDLRGCAGHEVNLPPLIAAEIPSAVPAQLSFLVPASDPAKRRSEQITAVVHFPQGRYVLLRDFADNRRQLGRIDSLTERMFSNDSVTIETVYLKGYASPEDTYAYNTRLSANRVRTMQRYLEERFGLEGAPFTTATEPEDWDSLRRWVVRSELPARDDVLAVIDTVTDPDARDHGIWRIDNGRTYLFLLHDVYPQLRRVDYRIGYLLPAFTVAQTRRLLDTRPEWLSVGELCRLAETYPLDSPERAHVCTVAIECYPDDPCVCNNMAMLALRRGDVALARECLARCADDPQVQNTLGVLCLMDGDREKARHCFALAADHGSAEGAYNLTHLDELVCEW